MQRNIFVLGLDEMNLATLEQLPGAERYRFHQLLTIQELQHGDDIPFDDLLDKATRQLEDFDGAVDAIVGYWDFPVSSMVPLLNRRFGLRSALLEAVLTCEHKYWSRVEQAKAVEEIPRFALVDLDREAEPPALDYPYWLKPVKAFSSELAFRVADEREYHEAFARIREGIGRVGRPFDRVLEHADPPPNIAAAGGMACIAEEEVRGQQITVEGYCLDGHVTVYGAIDSLCYPDTSSFLRFQYPSQIPEPVLGRMTTLSQRIITQMELDPSTFNIEFFWDPDTDALSVLEVNPRHSQSHAHLFADVDGMPNHKAMVELALGHDPQLAHRQGRYGVAAKWFLRRFTDGVVTRSPSDEEVAAIQADIPGVTVDLVARRGDRLSQLWDQDSYSYKLANVYIGADDTDDLIDKYERCVEALPFAFDDVDEE